MYVLPDELRDYLKEPLGPIVDTDNLIKYLLKKNFIISVGDFVTFTIIKSGIVPDLCIVDNIIERKNYSEKISLTIKDFDAKVINVKNPPGMITDELWNSIEFVFKQRNKGNFLINVDGEEDLAALAAIYIAPSDATVIYGMPNKGAVIVEATKANKQKVKEVLDKM